MSNPLTTFIFEGASIRVFGDSVSPLFVAADICNALNLTNPSQWPLLLWHRLRGLS